jgi:hypothetical protein
MTKTEMKELDELGLTPEQLAAKTSRMEELAREAKHVPPMTLGEVMRSEEREVPAPKQRKKRADAGIAKGPRKPPPSEKGVLQEDQWAHLSVLVTRVVQTSDALLRATDDRNRAYAEYQDYLDSLKA